MKKGIIIRAVVVALAAAGVIAIFISPTEKAPTGYRRYSKYDFSFEYPENMILHEGGLLEAMPTNDSGIVRGDLSTNGKEVIGVSWRTTAMVSGLENAIDDSFKRLVSESENFFRKEIVEVIKEGHRMIYQEYAAAIGGEKVYGIHGAWNCDRDDKIYVLSLLSSEANILPVYQRYLNSFVCHGIRFDALWMHGGQE